MTEKEKKEGESGSHEDNDFSRVQKVMKDNDIPFYNTAGDDNEDDEDDSDNFTKH